MAEIRALTVRPPWSWAIADLGKDVENRTWTTDFRGLLAIHAGARLDREASFPVREAQRAYRAIEAEALLAGKIPPEAARLHGRHVVAVAALAGVHHARECRDRVTRGGPLCSPWAFHGEYHWQLEDVRPLAPVHCHPGQLRLWTLPGDVEKAVRAQLEEAGHGQ